MGEHNISGTAQIEVSTHHTHEPTVAPGETVETRAERILAGDIRPDDYLEVPPGVTARVDWEIAKCGVAVTTEMRQWMLDTYALQFHCSGNRVVCWRTGKGVIVLGVGETEARAVLALMYPITPEQHPDIAVEYP